MERRRNQVVAEVWQISDWYEMAQRPERIEQSLQAHTVPNNSEEDNPDTTNNSARSDTVYTHA